MKQPKVRLYIRVRRPSGRSQYFDPVWTRNRTLRQGYALVDGGPEAHPGSTYYLRYLRNGKRIFESIGVDADKAMVAFRNKQHDLQSIVLGRITPATVHQADDPPRDAEGPSDVLLRDAVAEYLDEIRRFKAPKTFLVCKHMLKLLEQGLPGKFVRDITRKDLLDHMSALKQRGMAERTVFNHIMRIVSFLKGQGIVGLLRASDKPRYEEKDVQAYDPEQLAKLLAAANAEERMLFQFFLGTGFRDQEVMFTTWKNVDFKGKVIAVRSKPEMGFRIKDKEERSVPVPDTLIAALASWKKHSASVLVFPGNGGKPNGHFLRTLQKVAFRAGLNCGECLRKSGKSCQTHAVCGEWGLHKFRKTFATMHSEAGISVRTISRFLGHSDLAVTLRYLASADLRSERTRNQVNMSFAMLDITGE